MDSTTSPDSIGSAPSAPPSPPGSDTSITSWPATDISSTATADYDGPVPISAARSLVGSSPVPAIESAKSLAPLDTQFETASVSSELEDETPTVESFVTPVSPRWAVSKIPVSEGEDDGVSPVSAVKIDGKGPARPFEAAPRPAASPRRRPPSFAQEIKATTEVDAPVESECSPIETDKPAFILTKATICGENEAVSLTQPSTPSASSLKDDEATEAEGSRTSPVVTRIMTTGVTTPFLLDTQQFFASPTFTNHAAPNSAVSPKTSAFFSVGVRSPLGVPFPPHQRGAFITELCPSDAVGQETKMRREPKHKQNDDEQPASHSTGFSTGPLTSPNGSNRQRGLSPGHRHRSRSHSRSRSNSRNRRHKSSEPKTRLRVPASEHTDPVTITALIRELKSALEHEPTAFYTFKGVLADESETETEKQALRHRFASRPCRDTDDGKVHQAQYGSRHSQAVPFPPHGSPVPPCYPPHLSPRRHRGPLVPDIARPPPSIIHPVPVCFPLGPTDFGRARNVDHAQIPHKGRPKTTKEVKRLGRIIKKQGGKSQWSGMIGADEIRGCSRGCAEPIEKEKEQHSHVVRVIERRHSLDSTAGFPAFAQVQRINPHGGKRSSSFKDHPGNSMKLAPLKSALTSDTKIQLYPTPTLRFAFFRPSGRRVPPPPSSSVPSCTGAGLNKENGKHSHLPVYPSPVTGPTLSRPTTWNKSRPSTSGEEYGDRFPGPPGRVDTISFEFDDFF
ncbi:hypothetical protein JCM1841_003786 [Sporobolomyces salmonicolor]